MSKLQRRIENLEEHAWPAQDRYVFVDDNDPRRQAEIDAARAALGTGERLTTVPITGGFTWPAGAAP